jgi:hypothetical protein
MRCPKCGQDNTTNGKFCNYCGTSLDNISFDRTAREEALRKKIEIMKQRNLVYQEKEKNTSITKWLFIPLIIIIIIVSVPLALVLLNQPTAVSTSSNQLQSSATNNFYMKEGFKTLNDSYSNAYSYLYTQNKLDTDNIDVLLYTFNEIKYGLTNSKIQFDMAMKYGTTSEKVEATKASNSTNDLISLYGDHVVFLSYLKSKGYTEWRNINLDDPQIRKFEIEKESKILKVVDSAEYLKSISVKYVPNLPDLILFGYQTPTVTTIVKTN